MSDPTRTAEILEIFLRHEVDLVVVGMTAAVLQGAPALTFDLDVVYSRDPANVARLLAALRELSAVFRADPRRIVPTESHLTEDVGFEELVPDTILMPVGELDVRVLTLAKLIEVKERAGRPKDLAVLPLLRATLARSSPP